MVIAHLRRFVVRHIGKTGSAAHGACQHGFVFLSWHPANMRPDRTLFQSRTLPQSNWPTTQASADLAGLKKLKDMLTKYESILEMMESEESDAQPPNSKLPPLPY
jgi:hypothetical protein